MADNLTKVFKSFIEDIIKVFPEYNKRLNNYYKEVLESDDYEGEKLTDFMNNIEEISDKVAEKDITLFDDDPIILQNVSFKTIWCSGITNQTKMDIWKYLQSFCIMKINLESKDKMDDVLKKIESHEKIKDKKTVENMKKLKKLNESINAEELQKLFLEDPEKVTESMNEMENMFENTSIGKIAKEITEDLDIENMIEKDGGIEGLFNGGNMMNIFQSISSKMDLSGGDAGNLMEEASQICGQMQGNPIFSTLMSNMQQSVPRTNPEPRAQPTEKQIKNINVGDPVHNPNKTRERLQKKLQGKQKNVTVEKKD